MLHKLLLYQTSHIDFNSALQRQAEKGFPSRKQEEKKQGDISFLKKIFFSNLEWIVESYPPLNIGVGCFFL